MSKAALSRSRGVSGGLLVVLPLLLIAVGANYFGRSYALCRWPTANVRFSHVTFHRRSPLVTLHYQVRFRNVAGYDLTYQPLRQQISAEEEEERIGGEPLIQLAR